MFVPVFDTLQSPMAQMTVDIGGNTYPSSSQEAIIYTIPSSILVSFNQTDLILGPFRNFFQSPTGTEKTSILRSSIPTSPSRTETCNCQCPISGFIPIYYNSEQQSCASASLRKRRDHNEWASPVD